MLHFKILLGMLFSAIIPPANTEENDASIKAFLKKNRATVFFRSLGMVFIIALLMGCAKFLLGDHLTLFWALNLLWIFSVVVGLAGIEWIVRSLILPLSWLKCAYGSTIKNRYDQREPNLTYLNLAEELTSRFWKSAGKKPLVEHLKANSLFFGRRTSTGRTSTNSTEENRVEKSDLENASVNQHPSRHTSQRKVGTQPMHKQKSETSWATRLILGFAGISTAIIVITFLQNNLNTIGAGVVLVLAVASVIFGSYGLLMHSIHKSDESKTFKRGIGVLFTIIAVTLFIAVAGAGLYFVDKNVKALVNGKLGILNNVNTQGVMVANSNNVETAAQVYENATATPTATSTQTPEPSATPAPERNGKLTSIQYSLADVAILKDSLESEISSYVVNANGITVFLNEIATQIEAKNADLAPWGQICTGKGLDADAVTPNKVIDLNISYLETDVVSSDGIIVAFLKRLNLLKDDPLRPIAPEEANRLGALGTLLLEHFKQTKELCGALTETEILYDLHGEDNQEELSDAEKLLVSKAFIKAYEIEQHIADIDAEINRGLPENSPKLMPLQAPDGSNLSQWLELKFSQDVEDMLITQTPGPTIENIVQTLLPPTSTPEPTATSAFDGCLASISVDDGRTFRGFQYDLETDEQGDASFYKWFEKSPAAYFEGYSPACTAWAFYWSIDIDGDGQQDWGLVDHLSLTTGINDYRLLPTDRRNFTILLQPDPDSIAGLYTMATIIETGEYLWKAWPVPVPTQTAYATECHPVFGEDQRIGITQWQYIETLPFKNGYWAQYYKCGPTFAYYIMRPDIGKMGWFLDSNTPSNIPERQPFWVSNTGAYAITLEEIP